MEKAMGILIRKKITRRIMPKINTKAGLINLPSLYRLYGADKIKEYNGYSACCDDISKGEERDL